MKGCSIALALALGALAPAAHAQTATSTVQINARAEVAAALYAASATQAAAERAADSRLRAQAAEIERLRREGRASRTQIAELEERYVAGLAERDRAFAQEIAVFRSAVEDIASTPEGLAILAERRPGNLRQARTALLDLIQRRNAAEERASHIRQAANLRTGATIALDDRARGEASTGEVIALYEQVTALDPSMSSDWLALAGLYHDGATLDQAERAAETGLNLGGPDQIQLYDALGGILISQGRLVEADAALSAAAELARQRFYETRAASDEREFALGNLSLGDLRRLQGDHDGARSYFETSLSILQSLADADPNSLELQDDLAVITDRMGDVAQYDLAVALSHYEASLTIRHRLALADPNSRRAQLAVSASLDRIGDVLAAQGDFERSRALYEESLAVRRRLAAANSSSMSAQQNVARSLDNVGYLLELQGDLSGALARYEESLAIRESVAAVDPGSPTDQLNISVSLGQIGRIFEQRSDFTQALSRYEESLAILRQVASTTDHSESAWARNSISLALQRIGDVLLANGDRDGARRYYVESLTSAQDLATEDAGAAGAQRGVWVAMWRLVVAFPADYTWANLVAAMEEMERRGGIAPGDLEYLEMARRNAARERQGR